MLIEDRIRRVVSQVTEDASLTEDMDDAPAMRLLDWGSSVARRLALLTVEMEDQQADEVLEPQLQSLRRTIRRVNKLVAMLPDAASDEVTEGLQRIFEAAAELPRVGEGAPVEVSELAGRLAAQSPDAVLDAVLAHL
jgi:hypothetical protein